MCFNRHFGMKVHVLAPETCTRTAHIRSRTFSSPAGTALIARLALEALALFIQVRYPPLLLAALPPVVADVGKGPTSNQARKSL